MSRFFNILNIAGKEDLKGLDVNACVIAINLSVIEIKGSVRRAFLGGMTTCEVTLKIFVIHYCIG